MAKSLEEIVKKLERLNKVIAANRASTTRKATVKKSAPSRKSAPKPVAKPKAPSVKRGLTIDSLMANTPASRRANAIRDRVTIVGFRINPAKTKIISKTLTYDTQGRRVEVRPHNHWVLKCDDDPANLKLPFSKARVKIGCDCEDHLFRWEYALNHHGAADILRSNGEFPVFTNPGLVPGTCKHLAPTVLRYIKSKRF